MNSEKKNTAGRGERKKREMIISIASGKGGTGKTTVAVNLACAVSKNGIVLVDSDVEEPNAALFLKPDIKERTTVNVCVPEIDTGRCDYCGKCREICRFNAITVISDQVLTFPMLCHSCGGCSLVCPRNAIIEKPREIGVVETGKAGSLDFYQGILNTGEAMSPPLIAALKRSLPDEKTIIIDAPPGTACPMVEAVKDSDYCILVTEPTPFGLNDLELAAEVTRRLEVPCGVVINRSDRFDGIIEKYCDRAGVPIIGRIPFDRRIAESYSRGEIVIDAVPEYEREFKKIYKKTGVAI